MGNSTKKTAKKVYKFVKKNIVEPYTSKKNNRGYNNRMNLYKEITAIKKLLNAEKKNQQYTDTTVYKVAQNNGAGSGALTVDITPVISQGSSEDQRNGDSIKVCSMCAQFELSTNSFLTLQSTKVTIYVVRQLENDYTTANIIPFFLLNNPFSGVIDYNSDRNYQFFKKFVVMAQKTVTLRQNQNDSANQVQKVNIKVPLKLDYHMRYNKGLTTLITNPVFLIAVADSGDTAGTNYINIQMGNAIYYYDN